MRRRRRSTIPGALVPLLALAAAAGCASSSGASSAEVAPGDAGARENRCAEGCSLRVENRLSTTRLEVTFSHHRGVDVLGRVPRNTSEVFEIREFDSDEFDVWVWDARTGERLGVYRVRQFPGGEGRVVVSSR